MSDPSFADALSDSEVRIWINACNHEPARQALRQLLAYRIRGVSVPLATDKPGVREAAGDDEMYEIGKRDGYEEAVQDIDLMTGGDGEYRVAVFLGGGVDEDRHCPDPAAMKARIAERFVALSAPLTEEQPKGGHCVHKKQPGGCQLHNLHCGWPDCDTLPRSTPGGAK